MWCCYCTVSPPLLHSRSSLPFSRHQYRCRTSNLHSSVICNFRDNDKSSIPSQSHSFSDQFQSPSSSSDTDFETLNRPQQLLHEEESHFTKPNSARLFSNMWWVDMKASLGQRINIEGILSSVSVLLRDQHLALPHVSVRNISFIDWTELRRRGFKGVVFDKDNTITVPYSLKFWGPLESSVQDCKSVFGNNVAVFSNSAGLYEYDHDCSKATALEKAIGITVIRHRVKKPAGTAEEIEKHFGCKSSQLIMIGDRPFTDVVYGNRNGFFTILTEPLSLSEEPFIVRLVRKVEALVSKHWIRKGLRPISHNLVPDAIQCIKDVPSL